MEVVGKGNQTRMLSEESESNLWWPYPQFTLLSSICMTQVMSVKVPMSRG